MLRFIPYILKSLWRHRTRTMLTVTGSAVALFIFCFVGAIREGLHHLIHNQAAERTLIAFQANRYCPSTSRLPDHYTRTIAKMDGVKEVVPIKVFTNNCRASLDVVVFHAMPADKVKVARNFRLVAGDFSEFERRRDAALVGRALASRRGLSVGKPFFVGMVTVNVAGIFAADHPADDHVLFCHLDFLQRTPGLNSVGAVTQFEVQVADNADPQKVARAIDDRFRGGPVQTDTRTKGLFQANAVGDLAELIHFANYLGFACVGLVLALVATTTLMAVQDRIREHAILQTLGFTPLRIFVMVIVEGLLVSLAGGVIGIGAALGFLSWSNMAVGTEAVIISFLPSFDLAMIGLAVAAGVGCLATLVPALKAARAEIVSSLRAV